MRSVKKYADQDGVWYNGIRMPHLRKIFGLRHRLVDDAWFVCDLKIAGGFGISVEVDYGFVFDGCSVPRWLWWIAGDPFAEPRIAAALVHDWLYTSQVCNRKHCDLIYKSVCEAVGMPRFRCWVEYWAVRMFGWVSWRRVTPWEREFARDRGALVCDDMVVSSHGGSLIDKFLRKDY